MQDLVPALDVALADIEAVTTILARAQVPFALAVNDEFVTILTHLHLAAMARALSVVALTNR